MDGDEAERIFSRMKKGESFIPIDIDKVRVEPIAINPPKDFIKQETFPDCCAFHQQFNKVVNDWFDKFPLCCESHSKLASIPNFEKSKYEFSKNLILDKVEFTSALINHVIDHHDWYENITDYIEYVRHSFGHPPFGLHIFELTILHLIESKTEKDHDFPDGKKKKLLEFLTYEPKIKEGKEVHTDLNILKDIYSKWLKALPDIDPLTQHKEAIKNRMPFFYEPQPNRYSGLTKFKIRTQSELIDFLQEATIIILKKLDGLKFIEEHSKSAVQNRQLEIIKSNHKLTQLTLLGTVDHNSQPYIKTIKQWLKNEKEFFAEITPLLQSVKTPSTKPDPSFLDLFLNNEGALDRVLKLLRQPSIAMIDENNKWIYEGKKSALLACFKALEDLRIIKIIGNKSMLQRVVLTKINIDANDKLFRLSYDESDYHLCYDSFKKDVVLKAVLNR